MRRPNYSFIIGKRKACNLGLQNIKPIFFNAGCCDDFWKGRGAFLYDLGGFHNAFIDLRRLYFVDFGKDKLIGHRGFIKHIHQFQIGGLNAVPAIDEDKDAAQRCAAPQKCARQLRPLCDIGFGGAGITIPRQINNAQTIIDVKIVKLSCASGCIGRPRKPVRDCIIAMVAP